MLALERAVFKTWQNLCPEYPRFNHGSHLSWHGLNYRREEESVIIWHRHRQLKAIKGTLVLDPIKKQYRGIMPLIKKLFLPRTING
jgi:hypothetical protein